MNPGIESKVQNVSFPDEDLDLLDLGGLLEWLPPVDMSQAGDGSEDFWLLAI